MPTSKPAKKTPVTLDNRIAAFVALGQYLREGGDQYLEKIIRKAHEDNRWFIPYHIREALHAWGNVLTKKKIHQWLAPYNLQQQDEESSGRYYYGW